MLLHSMVIVILFVIEDTRTVFLFFFFLRKIQIFSKLTDGDFFLLIFKD